MKMIYISKSQKNSGISNLKEELNSFFPLDIPILVTAWKVMEA